MLRECGGARVPLHLATAPDELALPLAACFKGFQKSAVVDNAHNVVKDHLRDTKSDTMRHHERWMLPHVESVLQSFGRDELSPKASERSGSRRLPPSSFDCLAGDPSINDEELRGILGGAPSWQTRTPQSNNLTTPAMHLLMQVGMEEKWGDARHSWQGIIIMPVGSIVQKHGADGYYLCCTRPDGQC